MKLKTLTCPNCNQTNNFLAEECTQCGINFSKYFEELEKAEELRRHIEEQEKAEALRQEQEEKERLQREKEEQEKAEALKRQKEEEQLRREKEEQEKAEALKRQKEEEERAKALKRQEEERLRREKEEQEKAEALKRQKEEEERARALKRQKEEEERLQREKEEHEKAEALKRQREQEKWAEVSKRQQEEEERQRREQEQKATSANAQNTASPAFPGEPDARSENQTGGTALLSQILVGYVGQTIGLSFGDRRIIKAVRLLSVGEDHFTVLFTARKLSASFPLQSLSLIAECMDGISAESPDISPVFTAVLQVDKPFFI